MELPQIAGAKQTNKAKTNKTNTTTSTTKHFLFVKTGKIKKLIWVLSTIDGVFVVDNVLVYPVTEIQIQIHKVLV